MSNPLGPTGRSLRRLLLGYWLGSSLLLGSIMTLLNIWHHQNQFIRDGNQSSHLVTTMLRSSLTAAQRQQLVEHYGQSSQEHHVEGINVLLVVDRNGTVAFSSRPTWRSLRLADPIFDQLARDDPDFGAVVSCFRRHESHCMQTTSVDWHMHMGSFTVVRPVAMPSLDLGLPRQPYLVLVNFDSGVVLGDLLQEMPVILLLATVIASLLSGALAVILYTRLVPQLMEYTQTDALTQLMNRTSFMDLAMGALAAAEEEQNELVFAILDIDHFKRINDTYGHSCGDAALAAVGALLLNVTRPDDMVCRFGGEEFALLLVAPRDAGAKALERLRLQVEMNNIRHRGHRIQLTASIGAVATADFGYNIDYLYNAADKALYAAKHRGRNRLEWNMVDPASRLLPAVPLSSELGRP